MIINQGLIDLRFGRNISYSRARVTQIGKQNFRNIEQTRHSFFGGIRQII